MVKINNKNLITTLENIRKRLTSEEEITDIEIVIKVMKSLSRLQQISKSALTSLTSELLGSEKDYELLQQSVEELDKITTSFDKRCALCNREIRYEVHVRVRDDYLCLECWSSENYKEKLEKRVV